MARITCGHHVFGVEHLLGKFTDRHGTVLLGTTACKRSKTRHEEMKTRKWHHVHCKFSQVCIQLVKEEFSTFNDIQFLALICRSINRCNIQKVESNAFLASSEVNLLR